MSANSVLIPMVLPAEAEFVVVVRRRADGSRKSIAANRAGMSHWDVSSLRLDATVCPRSRPRLSSRRRIDDVHDANIRLIVNEHECQSEPFSS